MGTQNPLDSVVTPFFAFPQHVLLSCFSLCSKPKAKVVINKMMHFTNTFEQFNHKENV